MAQPREIKKKKRLARLKAKADELGITVDELKKQKRDARINKLAKQAKKAGMSLKDYRKYRKKERQKKRQEEARKEQEKREKRRKEGPVSAVSGVIVPAGRVVEPSKDPIGDFINRYKDKGIKYIRSVVTGKWGYQTKKANEILERVEKELGSKDTKKSKNKSTKLKWKKKK